MKNFNDLINKFKYNSLQYFMSSIDDIIIKDDQSGYICIHYDDQKDINEIRFALNDVDDLIDVLNLYNEKFLIPFVPKSWIKALEALGARLESVFKDYRKLNLDDVVINDDIKHLSINEIDQAALLTQNAIGESRGFFGQNATWFKGWLDGSLEDVIDNKLTAQSVLIKKNEQGQIIGLICVGVYQSLQTTCWIRELVVDKRYQHQKIGQNLLNQGLAYGKARGATQAFLLVDELNEIAIHIYKKFEFIPDDTDGQIDMIINHQTDNHKQ